MDDKNKDVLGDNTFNTMLRAQWVATMVVAFVAYFISGKHAGLSALAGGFSVLIAAFVATKIANTKSKNPSVILVSMLKAELVKILLIVVLLFLVFKYYQALVPGALLAGLGVAAIISGIAVSRNKTTI